MIITTMSIVVYADGSAKQPGVHYSSERYHSRLLERRGNLALFYTPPTPFWDGCKNTTSPAQYEIVRLRALRKVEYVGGDGFTAVAADIILRREPGRKWKTCRKEMIKVLELLSSGE